ncbi:MAG: nucleotide exchange factor GrpE [Proteobacteria bacterium]|nr:nucleotide exchange factor GrpE [Pseudomonadota bacterium]
MELVAAVIGWVVALGAGGFALSLSHRREELAGLLSDARRRGEALEQSVRKAVDDRDTTVKRVRDQASDEKRFAHEALARDVLDVLDNFERALEQLPDDIEEDPVLDGVRMTQTQLLATLARHGVEPVPALGEPFDPAIHEAIGTQPSLEPPNTVVTVWQGGYRLHGRLLRAAKVVLAVEPEVTDVDEVTEEVPASGAEE